MQPTYEPVSLGARCETKLQICLTLLRQRYPQWSDARLRMALAPPDLGDRYFERRLFDWTGVWFDSLCEYLERDFQGLYERDDLIINEIGVLNRRFNTVHTHDYQFVGEPMEGLTQAMLDEQYPAARRHFEALADGFRRHLTTPGPYLYVVGDFTPTREQAERLIGLLGARSTEHQFHLLFMGFEDQADPPAGLEGRASFGIKPRASGKPDYLDWEGHDESWRQALSKFSLSAPDCSQPVVALHPIAPVAPESDAEPAAPPARGFLQRLFAR